MQILTINSAGIIWGHTSLGVFLALQFYVFAINRTAKVGLVIVVL